MTNTERFNEIVAGDHVWAVCRRCNCHEIIIEALVKTAVDALRIAGRDSCLWVEPVEVS